MPSLTLDDRLIWFAHCPKAGGTSIETLMVERWGDAVGHLHWGWDLWWRQGGWRRADPPNSPQHLIWSDAERLLGRRPDCVFALVRDPAARIMSEYRYQRRHRRGTRTGRALAFLPFALWLRLMLAVVRRNPHAFDNHLRPQGDFVPPHAEVFLLENGLQPVVDWIAKHTGTSDIAVPHARLATGQGRPPGDGALARIAVSFAGDYARFGYSLPDMRPPRRDLLDRIAELVAPLVVALERRGRI